MHPAHQVVIRKNRENRFRRILRERVKGWGAISTSIILSNAITMQNR